MMNNYTEQDILELAHQFKLAYPVDPTFDYNDENIRTCLDEYSDDPVRAIMEFLVGYWMLGTTTEATNTTYALTFDIPLHDMPKYFNDIKPWKTAIAKWRLKIGK